MRLDISKPQNKVNDDNGKQHKRKHRWAGAIVEALLVAIPDVVCAPQKGPEGVEHAEQGNEGEEQGRDDGGAVVAEVQHSNGQGA